LKDFVRDAVAAGVDGVLALDLPPEEAEAYEAAMKREDCIRFIWLRRRRHRHASARLHGNASGFIYYVSREGVTGMQKKLAPAATKHVTIIRKHSKLPVAIGLGFQIQRRRARRHSGGCGGGGQRDCDQIAKHGRIDNWRPKWRGLFARWCGRSRKRESEMNWAVVHGGWVRRTFWPQSRRKQPKQLLRSSAIRR